MHKELLLTPGPTQVPMRIFKAMEQPAMHHRTEIFKECFRTALDGLKWLTRSASDPILIAGSGTAALEASLLNTCRSGDKIITLNAGKFGERWTRIAERLSLQCVELRAEWGESFSAALIEKTTAEHPDARAICMTLCETSTAVQHPVEELCRAAKKVNPAILTIVDSVSAIGTLPIYTEQMQADILAAAGHKGLMLPPGLAMLFLNQHAWQAVENNKTPSLYFDLLSERKAHAKSTTAWTPAMNHILGLNESILMIREEGEDNFYARHGAMSRAARAALQALGLAILGDKHPSAGVTAGFAPAGIDAEKLRSVMLKKWGVRIAGGQDHLKGKIFRIGHMGYTGKLDILACIGALEMALAESGHKFKTGTGVAAALETFNR